MYKGGAPIKVNALLKYSLWFSSKGICLQCRQHRFDQSEGSWRRKWQLSPVMRNLTDRGACRLQSLWGCQRVGHNNNKNPRELSPSVFTTEGYCEVGSLKHGEVLTEPNHASTQYLGLPAFRTVRGKFLLFIIHLFYQSVVVWYSSLNRDHVSYHAYT